MLARASKLLLLMAASSIVATPARADVGCDTICWLDAQNRPIDGARDAVEISRFVTNGDTLPHAEGYDDTSLAPTDLRVQIAAKALDSPNAFAVVESRTPNGLLRGSLKLPLTRPKGGVPFRSPFVRLVGDAVDLQAHGAEGRALLVALRDSVVVRYGDGPSALERRVRVGAEGNAPGPVSAQQARVVVHILRRTAGAKPVIGHDDASALLLMRQQLQAANQIWLQCELTFGSPDEVAMEVVDPPPGTLLAVANEDGLPARGGGELRFQIGDQAFGPIATHASATPLATAHDIEHVLRARGFYTVVSQNLTSRSGAGPSADVLVRRADGSFVDIEPQPDTRLSTDARQTLRVGRVDLADGLREFDNMTAQVGSLEERTLIKALSDGDDATIDLFVVNQFSGATRQGEAFIAEHGAAIVNTVLLDRNGLRHLPLAWTLAHELGHVLMNDPLHPDNIGPDRPWLLMDADNGRGTVDGPKRLREEDCQRARAVARAAARPLLVPYDVASPPG
jgi:hypothetical protein